MANQNRVTEEWVTAMLDAATVETYVFHNKEVVASYKLTNGFTVTGRAACVDPANFNYDKGLDIARQDAKRQLWRLEGYRLQVELHNRSEL